MAETRPSGAFPLPDIESPVTQEVAEIGMRGRLHILPRWIKRLGWMPTAASEDLALLLIMGEPGQVSLRPWSPIGPAIVERFKELQSTPETDSEALRLIIDTYGQVVVPQDRRVHLGDLILQHLGLPTDRTAKSNVYVVIRADRIEMLSPAYRNEKHIAGFAALDDLLG